MMPSAYTSGSACIKPTDALYARANTPTGTGSGYKNASVHPPINGPSRKKIRNRLMNVTPSRFLLRLSTNWPSLFKNNSNAPARTVRNKSHRHLPVPYRRTGGQGFRRVDDGVGVDAVVAVEVADRASLAEMLDAERFNLVTAHAAEPAQRRRMAVDYGDDAAVARQRRQQFFDMAEMRQPAPIPAPLSRRRPPRMQPIRGRDRQQADIPAAFADQADRLDRLGRDRAGIGDHRLAILTGLAQPIGAVGDALLQVWRHHPLWLGPRARRKPQINPAPPAASAPQLPRTPTH